MAKTAQRRLGRDIVAIGASAGGLSALTQVLCSLKPNLPACLLIVQHLDPRYPSHMADILAKRSRLHVVEARDRDKIERGTVYIAPPDRHMLVEGDRILLTVTELVHFVRPSVDLLLESVAAAYDGRAIGVILTGSGTDGALGFRAIKEKGGLTIVQDPDDAESSGMPNAAVATNCADIIVPLSQIGPELNKAVEEET